MKTIIVGPCAPDHTFELQDPDGMNESEFEYKVARALACMYPTYHKCFPFSGTFKFYDERHRPDLALIAHDFSHWFVIEVELSSHSYSEHVLPQVRALRWGDAQDDCIPSLEKATGYSRDQIRTLLRMVPKTVAVIANKQIHDWEVGLSSLDVQFLSAQVFNSPSGIEAVEISGQMQSFQENLGFGRYSAIDSTLQFPKAVRLPDGQIQISDPDGGIGSWTVTRDERFAWVQKVTGTPDLAHGHQFQLIRAISGRIVMRRPLTD